MRSVGKFPVAVIIRTTSIRLFVGVATPAWGIEPTHPPKPAKIKAVAANNPNLLIGISRRVDRVCEIYFELETESGELNCGTAHLTATKEPPSKSNDPGHFSLLRFENSGTLDPQLRMKCDGHQKNAHSILG
jgi:hypothetical protein